MTVTVFYYGLLAERRGLTQERVLSFATTAAKLYQELDAIHQLGLCLEDFRVAHVNRPEGNSVVKMLSQ